MKAPRSGGASCALWPCASGTCNLEFLAIDSTNVYWTDSGTAANNFHDGTVMRVAIGGGTAIVLASGQDYPLGIAVDDSSVYWTNVAGNGANQGKVLKVAK